MKKLLYTLLLCLISTFAFAQEPAPPTSPKPVAFTGQFFMSITDGDTSIYLNKGPVLGWTKLAKASQTILTVDRTIKGDGTLLNPMGVDMDSTATAINNFLLAKNANGDIVPINANFSTDNNTIIFNGIKINANAGIILNPSLQSGTAWFAKIDSATHMIVKDTSERLKLYINALTRVRGNMLGVDSLLVGGRTASTRTILQPGSGNYYAPSRSMHQTAARYMNANADTSIIYSDWVFRTDTTLFKGVNPVSFKTKLYSEYTPTSGKMVANKDYVDSRPSINLGNTNLTANAARIFDYDAYSITFGGLGKPSLYADGIEAKLYYNSNDFSNIVHSATVNSSGINLASQSGFFQQSNIIVRPTFVDISTSPVAGGSEIRLEKDSAIMVYTYQNNDGHSPGMRYTTNDYALAHLDSLWIPNWKSVQRYADSVASAGGGVTSVSGTTNRITSTGGTTPVINISSTFEALLGKVANPLSQFASTTSSQLAGVVSDESGTGALLFAGSPALTGTPTTPTATGVTSTIQIASTAQVHLAIIADTTSVIQNRTGAQNQFSNLASRIVTNTSNISANTTAIGLKQPRIVGNKPSATSTTYTTADSVTQVLSNLNSGIIANTASISAIPTYTASLGVSKVGNDFRSDTIYNQTVLNLFPKGDTRWLKTSTAATTYVPYTGATTDVALGAHGIGANKLTLAGNASPSYAAGALYFDTGNDALTFFNGDSNIGLQIGREEWIQVVNSSGSSIANGSAVYINSSTGGIPTIALAQANSGTTTICAGLTTETIANGATGYVTTLGVVHTLNTNAFVVGPIYLSATTPGAITQTIPSAPNYRYRIGFVTAVSATVGSIFITPSTASLGNGTANQLFGMNTGGTAQEVKSIVGSAATGQVVTNATNSITLSNDTTVVMPKANTKTLAQLQTAFNLKLNVSDTAAMAYVHKAIVETITGAKTFSPNVGGTTNPNYGTIISPAITVGVNSQIVGALNISPTYSNVGAFTNPIYAPFKMHWSTGGSTFSDLMISNITGDGDVDIHTGTTTPSLTNYNSRYNSSNTIVNGPGASGTFSARTNNTTGMTMFATRNVLFQNGGTATDSTAYRVSIIGRTKFTQFVAASSNDSLMAFNPTTHGTRMTKLVAGTGVGITYAPGTITLATANTPIIQGSADLTGQTAAGNVATFTVGAATATFNISSYINVTAVSVDVIQGQITYTDENNTAQTISLSSLSAIGNSTYSPVTIRAKNATVITVKTNLTTGAGSITFDTGARISQL